MRGGRWSEPARRPGRGGHRRLARDRAGGGRRARATGSRGRASRPRTLPLGIGHPARRRVRRDRPRPGRALADTVRRRFGAPRIVASGAGAFLLAPLEHTSPSDFTAQLSANLTGPFLVARAFLPMMRAAEGGRLVTIGSIADHRAFPDNAAYTAAKRGLRGLHEVLREEYRGSGVLCTLCPGPTDPRLGCRVPRHGRLSPRQRCADPRRGGGRSLGSLPAPHTVWTGWTGPA